MGSNMASDSGSEADIQQPTKKPMEVTEIPDSDAEDAENNPDISASARKLKGIIEHINVDSDDDDVPDEPVDFGEEEEEEEAPPSPKVSTPENKSRQQEDNDDAEDMQLDDDHKSPEPKPSDKKKTSPSSSKSRPKKSANSAPAKTIKKSNAVVKGKAKASKKTAAAKKSASLLKSVGKGSSSPKSKSGGKGSPKPQKKASAKSVSKVESKNSPKVTKKDAGKQETEKSKTVKPRKTINKATKQGKEKSLLKQKPKTPVNTFSKKTKTNSKGTSEPQSSKGGKVKSTKADYSKKKKSPKKTKTKKPTTDVEDEENTGEMEVTSEGEDTGVSSEADDEEMTCTPTSKLPIIGNLACSSRDANAQALLDHAVQQLGKYRVVNYGPDSDVNLHAYIISADTKRGWGILQALTNGARIVSEDWLSNSISEGSWQPISGFISDRFGKSPRSVTGADANNRILEGLRIKVACEGQDAPSVRKLVTLCGARVAETRIDVTITDIGKKIDPGTNVTKTWLADSVESGVAVEYQPYLVESG